MAFCIHEKNLCKILHSKSSNAWYSLSGSYRFIPEVDLGLRSTAVLVVVGG